VHEYYDSKSKSNKIDLCSFDVVLTTYAMLGMDYLDYEKLKNNSNNKKRSNFS